MIEKRRSRRLPVSMKLEISSLFKQDYVSVENIDAPITVVDVSKGGIGFTSQSVLPEGFYFNACIKLGDEEDAKMYCVIKIIRRAPIEKGYSYGCEMVGLAPVLSYIFEEYEKKLNIPE